MGLKVLLYVTTTSACLFYLTFCYCQWMEQALLSPLALQVRVRWMCLFYLKVPIQHGIISLHKKMQFSETGTWCMRFKNMNILNKDIHVNLVRDTIWIFFFIYKKLNWPQNYNIWKFILWPFARCCKYVLEK